MNDLGTLLQDAKGTGRVLVMGVLNTTPDSFYDGGRHLAASAARARIDELLAQGADLIDLGAESSRPGAAPVAADEQIERLAPALAHALERRALVSIDTTNARVAAYGLAAGARIVNDVSCLRDPELATAAAQHDAWLVITHSRTPMAAMSGFSVWPDADYADLVSDVSCDWSIARRRALAAGVQAERILFDPGLGFCKNARHSLELVRRLAEFRGLGVPILVGPGRKSFIAAGDGSSPDDRLGGTIAASVLCAQAGADIVRVHDVREVIQALRLLGAVQDTERTHIAPASLPRPRELGCQPS